MSAAAFNTLQYAKQLKAADVPERQAEVEAEILGKALDERDKALAALEVKVQTLATDTKRNAERMSTKEDIQQLRKDLETGQSALRQEIVIASKDLLIKLGGAIGVAVGVILAAMRWMPHA